MNFIVVHLWLASVNVMEVAIFLIIDLVEYVFWIKQNVDVQIDVDVEIVDKPLDMWKDYVWNSSICASGINKYLQTYDYKKIILKIQ